MRSVLVFVAVAALMACVCASTATTQRQLQAADDSPLSTDCIAQITAVAACVQNATDSDTSARNRLCCPNYQALGSVCNWTSLDQWVDNLAKYTWEFPRQEQTANEVFAIMMDLVGDCPREGYHALATALTADTMCCS